MIKNRIIFDGVNSEKRLTGMPLINDENYYNDRKYISNSMLGKLNKSPIDLRNYLSGGNGESTSSLSMGDAVHKGMLEPNKYKENIVTWSEKDFPIKGKTLRTKENKEWFINFKKENTGKCILKNTEWYDCEAIILSMKSKPEAMALLDNAIYEQISIGIVMGIPMKSKADIVRNDQKLIDIKTTSDIDINSFKKSCETYGYYRQAAMYCMMFDKTEFSFLVVEKSSPYKVAIYDVSSEKLHQGMKELIKLLEKYKYYFLDDDEFGTMIDDYVITGIL